MHHGIITLMGFQLNIQMMETFFVGFLQVLKFLTRSQLGMVKSPAMFMMESLQQQYKSLI